MTKHEEYVQRTEEFLKELQKTMDFEIVDVEFVKEAGTWYLRAYCDMEGGIGSGSETLQGPGEAERVFRDPERV